jgi:hypothetical protein
MIGSAAAAVALLTAAPQASAASLSKSAAHVAAEHLVRKEVETLQTPVRWEVQPARFCQRISATRVNCTFILWNTEEESGEPESWCPGVAHVRKSGRWIYSSVTWLVHPICVQGKKPS